MKFTKITPQYGGILELTAPNIDLSFSFCLSASIELNDAKTFWIT